MPVVICWRQTDLESSDCGSLSRKAGGTKGPGTPGAAVVERDDVGPEDAKPRMLKSKVLGGEYDRCLRRPVDQYDTRPRGRRRRRNRSW